MAEPEITEIIKLKATRLDGVESPANGFPILLMKASAASTEEVSETQDGANGHTVHDTDEGCGCCEDCTDKGGCGCCADCVTPALATKDVNAVGGIDEKPDIHGAQGVLQDLARLIESEAREMATGSWDEIGDIQLLSEAACLMRCFMCMEQYGDEDDGMAKELGPLTKEDVETFLAKRKINTADRKRLASEGKALGDGSYPIENAEDLHNAAILARSGHGDVAGAKRLIAKRAKELGVANPLASDAKKDQEGGTLTPGVSKVSNDTDRPEPVVKQTSEATEPQGDEKPDVQALVKEAVAEATKSAEEAIKELQDELAKVKATPIPGGPAITAPASVRDQRSKAEQLTKAARYDELADKVTELDLKKYYRTLASEAREAAGVPSSS